MVGVQGGLPEWHGIFDVVCINRYYGWHMLTRRLDEAAQALARELDTLHKSFDKPIIITEFGTDTLPGGRTGNGVAHRVVCTGLRSDDDRFCIPGPQIAAASREIASGLGYPAIELP
jgi:hypothetical protein